MRAISTSSYTTVFRPAPPRETPPPPRPRTRRGGGRQRGEDRGGAQVREQAELLADAQQAPLGPAVHGQAIPLRAAHGAEQHPLPLARPVQDRVRERHAAAIDGGAPDRRLLELETEAEARRDGLEDAARLARHLGPDAVAWQDED